MQVFRNFKPERLGPISASEVGRLVGDRRVIRNMPKIDVTVLNAKEVVAIGKTPDKFRVSPRSIWPAPEAAATLRKRFRYLGDHGTYYFLWSVGEKVPPWEEWGGRSSKPTARTKVRSKKPGATPARA